MATLNGLSASYKSSFQNLFFNLKYGFLDGKLRGYVGDLLDDTDYVILAECETLDDVVSYLSATERSKISNYNATHSHPSALVEMCLKSFVSDFNTLRSLAPEPLLTFLNYLTYGYMIDNVLLILAGILHGRDAQELIEKCHPLGMFDSIVTLPVATNMPDLYKLVLVDTPLASYFDDCMTINLDELNIELLRNTVYKAYLSDFLHLCKSLGGSTSCVMTELLNFEADRRALNITINSLGTELSRDDRRQLFPEFGNLYPVGHRALVSCDEYDQVRSVLAENPAFTASPSLLNKLAGETAVEKLLNEEEVRRCRLTLEKNFQYAGFFAYMKLKEQELKNLMWIAECISQQQKDRLLDGLVQVNCDSCT